MVDILKGVVLVGRALKPPFSIYGTSIVVGICVSGVFEVCFVVN